MGAEKDNRLASQREGPPGVKLDGRFARHFDPRADARAQVLDMYARLIDPDGRVNAADRAILREHHLAYPNPVHPLTQVG